MLALLMVNALILSRLQSNCSIPVSLWLRLTPCSFPESVVRRVLWGLLPTRLSVPVALLAAGLTPQTNQPDSIPFATTDPSFFRVVSSISYDTAIDL